MLPPPKSSDCNASATGQGLRVQLDAIPEAALVLDRQGQVCAANSAAAALFGYAIEELIGASSEVLVPESARPGHCERRTAYLAAPRRLQAVVEAVGRRRDVTEFPIVFSLAPLDNGGDGGESGEGSERAAAIVTVRDVPAHKRVELALRDRMVAVERTAVAKDRYFATMSHDLRAPLNAIIGFAGTLLMKLPGPLNVDQEHQLGIVRSSGQQLLAMLNDVIDQAKKESGRAAPRRESFDCLPVVEEVVTRLRYVAERKQLTLDLKALEIPRVIADRRAVQQIVYQLLDNAIKFCDRGAVNLTLRTTEREGGGWVEISVADTGAGLSGRDRDQLREAFRDPECPIRVGNGLGLHVARKFAQLIGGCLVLDSEYGSGSRFALLLPGE